MRIAIYVKLKINSIYQSKWKTNVNCIVFTVCAGKSKPITLSFRLAFHHHDTLISVFFFYLLFTRLTHFTVVAFFYLHSNWVSLTLYPGISASNPFRRFFCHTQVIVKVDVVMLLSVLFFCFSRIWFQAKIKCVVYISMNTILSRSVGC